MIFFRPIRAIFLKYTESFITNYHISYKNLYTDLIRSSEAKEDQLTMKAHPRITMRWLVLFIYLMCVFASFAITDASKLGWNPVYPGLPMKDYTPDYLLKNDVQVTVDAVKKEASLLFETTIPITGGLVYYGLDVPQPDVWILQYHLKATEQTTTASTSHEIKLDLGRFERQDMDVCNFRERGAVICYRLQLQRPSSDAPVYYYGRFRVDQNFNQLPCVTEGPFVDLVKADSATISFDTDAPTIASVVIKGKTFTDGQTSEHHEITIYKLSPSTHYDYYLVINDVKDLETHKFRTAPRRDYSRLKFAVMSDSRGGITCGEIGSAGGVNYDTLSKLLIDSYNRGAEFAIFGGDLINGYTSSEEDFRLQLKAWKDASELVGGNFPIYETMGNHEALTNVYNDGSLFGISFDKLDEGAQKSAESVFAEEFVNPSDSFPDKENTTAPSYSESAYYFDYANSRFIILNTDYWKSSDPKNYGGNKEGYVLDKQLKWLKEVLNNAQKNSRIRHVFVIGHTPMFPNDGTVAEQYLFDRRVALWQTLSQDSKVVAAFFGHEHNYNRMRVDRRTPIYPDNSPDPNFAHPVWQIVTGGVGAPFYALGNAPWSGSVKKFYPTRHYCLVSVEGERVELTVVSDSGEVVDRCTLNTGAHSGTVEKRGGTFARLSNRV